MGENKVVVIRYRWARRIGHVALLAACSTGGCRGAGGSASRDTSPADTAGPLLVFNAGSITPPIRAVLDSFAARTGSQYQQEPAASLELARKVTELGARPDVIALADYRVFPQLLMPVHVGWYALFAHNRIVLAYAPGARYAEEITTGSWRTILLRPGVLVGRADPNFDPSGYRTLLTWQLAERFYRDPGLYERLLRAAPPANVRPRESDLTGLLETRALDYAWTYQNLADDHGLKYVTLPHEIDLSAAADSAFYATASTRILGNKPGDTLTVRGEPIVYAVAITRDAPHPALAERFVAFLLSTDGQRILRARHLDAFSHGQAVGDSVPAIVAAALR